MEIVSGLQSASVFRLKQTWGVYFSIFNNNLSMFSNYLYYFRVFLKITLNRLRK